MKLGLIARADSRGLGIQTRAFYDHMRPERTLVALANEHLSAKPLPLRHNWYPDATWIDRWPTPRDFQQFFDGLDVVYTAETIYDHMRQNQAFKTAERMGVKTVLHVNPEFCDYFRHPEWPQPALYAAPSTWMFDKLPTPKVLLPVPVALEHFTPHTADKATNFLHVVGRPAIHDRAGTTDLIKALHHVHADIRVTITCQEPGYVRAILLAAGPLPANIDLHISDGDVDNYWQLYNQQHVLISPRRFGGLSLPMQEACAAGMPVIATNMTPQKDWLPAEWLVTASNTGTFTAHTEVDLWSADHLALAAKISQFANNPVFYRQASEQALAIAKQLSWDNLKPEYERVLSP